MLDRLKDMADMTQPSSFTGILDNPAMGKIYFFLKVAFWMVVVLIGAAAFYKYYLQYKIRITLSSRIGTGGVETVNDLGKVVTDEQGKRKIQIFKTRKGSKAMITFPIPEAKYKGKQGKRDHYYVWMDDNFQIHPISPPKPEDHFDRLVVRPQERDAWRRLEDDILLKKYRSKDKLLQYAAPAILMTACITAFLIFFFASKELGAGMGELAGTFKQIASSCTRLG